MEITINAYVIHSMENIEQKIHVVNELNYIVTRKALEYQKNKIIKILKKLKEEEIITTIYHPSNKKIQKQLDKLVTTKRLIKKTIEQIKISFYK
jgi:hypothetical protein